MRQPPSLPESLLAKLRCRYAEPHRRYHTNAHVQALLRGLDQRLHLPREPWNINAAIWFHDAIYQTRGVAKNLSPPVAQAQDNEGASAELARSELGSIGWLPKDVERVAELVLATRRHWADAEDTDAWLFLDLDLSVLARSPAVYANYVAGVRFEYLHVDDAKFRAGRAAVLRTFLERDMIYRTPELHAAWEAAARRNLQAELEALDTV